MLHVGISAFHAISRPCGPLFHLALLIKFERGDAAISLPQFQIVGVYELLCVFDCGFVVPAHQADGLDEMPVIADHSKNAKTQTRVQAKALDQATHHLTARHLSRPKFGSLRANQP